jgi:hypothetical protein
MDIIYRQKNYSKKKTNHFSLPNKNEENNNCQKKLYKGNQ